MYPFSTFESNKFTIKSSWSSRKTRSLLIEQNFSILVLNMQSKRIFHVLSCMTLIWCLSGWEIFMPALTDQDTWAHQLTRFVMRCLIMDYSVELWRYLRTSFYTLTGSRICFKDGEENKIKLKTFINFFNKGAVKMMTCTID